MSSLQHNITLEEMRLEIKRHGGPYTCIGYAASKDRRCHRQIAGTNGHEAATLLNTMTSCSREELEMVARLCLCGGYNHREQASRVARAWLEEVRELQDKKNGYEDSHGSQVPALADTKQMTAKVSPSRDDYSSGDVQQSFHCSGRRQTIKREKSRDEEVRSGHILKNAQRTTTHAHNCRELELESRLRDLQALNSRFNNQQIDTHRDLEASRATVSQLHSQLAAALQSNAVLRDQLESEQKRTLTYEKEQIATSIETKDLRSESKKWSNLLEDEQRRTFMYEKEFIATGIIIEDLRAKNHRLEQQMRQLADEVSAYRRDAVGRDEREQSLTRSLEEAKEQSLRRIQTLKMGYLCATEGETTQIERRKEEYKVHTIGMEEPVGEADLREEQSSHGNTRAAGLYDTCIWLVSITPLVVLKDHLWTGFGKAGTSARRRTVI